MTSLDVGSEGNPLSQISYWRLYAVFRLSHWGLRVINGVEVSRSQERSVCVCAYVCMRSLRKPSLYFKLSTSNLNHPLKLSDLSFSYLYP